MFRHIYSDRKDFSIIDVMHDAKMIIGQNYEGFTVIHVRLSEIIRNPSVMWDVYTWIERGRAEKRVVLLQNDISQESIKKTLKGRIPPTFDRFAHQLDRLIKSNTVAV